MKRENLTAKIRSIRRTAAVVLVGFLLLWSDGLAQAQSDDSGIPDDIPSITGIEITSTSDDTRLTGDDDENTIYIKHDEVEVTVSFSRDVTVTGTPHLGLEIGGLHPYLGVDAGANTRYAEYESVSGSEVVFTYTVVASDLDTDGIGIAADALDLNGGTVQDAVGNAANPTHGAFSFTNHLVVGFCPTGPWTYRVWNRHHDLSGERRDATWASYRRGPPLPVPA